MPLVSILPEIKILSWFVLNDRFFLILNRSDNQRRSERIADIMFFPDDSSEFPLGRNIDMYGLLIFYFLHR